MMMLSKLFALFNQSCPHDEVLTGVCIDSRQVAPGNLFVAIRGETFDGHQFIPQAIAKGAVAVVCSERMDDVSVPCLIVPDTLAALAIFAKAHRQQLNCSVIALTGSNGKTTVKEMISAILPPPAFATPGNLNNHIGVPLSVLQLNSEHRYAVFELGANHLGEIAYTAAIVQPKVTLINNIAPAHIEGFGSIDGVARAKGEIHQALSTDGTAVVNDDDAYAHFWDDFLVDKKTIRFSTVHPTAIHARDIRFNAEGLGQFTLVTPQGEAEINLLVPGAHNISNALAAAACTHALGIDLTDIVKGLSNFSGVSGRMTFLVGKNNTLIIDDTYNANLRSSLAALAVLAKRPGKRIFVFGDMGELGDFSQEHHEEIGRAARAHGIDLLMTCGLKCEATSEAFGPIAKHYRSHEALALDLLNLLEPKTTVLVKGSRSSAMEKIVSQLVA